MNTYYVTTGDDGTDQVTQNGKVVEDPPEAARLLAEAKDDWPEGRSGVQYSPRQRDEPTGLELRPPTFG